MLSAVRFREIGTVYDVLFVGNETEDWKYERPSGKEEEIITIYSVGPFTEMGSIGIKKAVRRINSDCIGKRLVNASLFNLSLLFHTIIKGKNKHVSVENQEEEMKELYLLFLFVLC